MAKFIFVTGGVVSGLGKGITAASLGRLLKARGLNPGTSADLTVCTLFVAALLAPTLHVQDRATLDALYGNARAGMPPHAMEQSLLSP